MAGIVETLNDRKAYFQELRNNDSEKLVGHMSQDSDRLAKRLGASQAESISKLRSFFSSQAKQSEAQSKQARKATTDAKFAASSAAAAQIRATGRLGYDIGNDISSLQSTIQRLLLSIDAKLDDIRKGSSGNGLIGDLIDDFGPRSRRGKGRGGKTRGRKSSKGKGSAKARRGYTSATAEPMPGRVPKAPGEALGAGSRARPGLLTRAKGVGAKAAGWLETGASRAKGLLSARNLGRLGGPVALATGAYTAYSALKDDSLTGGEKSQKVANAAGGTAGALALGASGGQLGAAIGTALLPGIGTAIGGALGGIGGGALGYFGGEKIVDTIGTKLSSAIDGSGIGTAIGRTTAIAMTPFSKEAREAFASDWKNNILPSTTAAFESVTTKLSSFAGSISDYTKQAVDVAKTVGTKAMGFAAAPARVMVRAAGAAQDFVAAHGGETGRRVVSAARNVEQRVASALPSSIAGALGFVSAKYESGSRGVHTVSSGKGDNGGVSYGRYQLATNNGSMSKFLASKEGAAYADKFRGLKPGSAEFNDAYKKVAGQDSAGFESAQHNYIVRTHYDKLANKVATDTGLDVSKRGRAVQEAIMSTAVQYGAGTSVASKAWAGIDVNKATDKELTDRLQDYKAQTVGQYFKSSSSAVQAGIANRIQKEKSDLAAVASDPSYSKGTNTNSIAGAAELKPAVKTGLATTAVGLKPAAQTGLATAVVATAVRPSNVSPDTGLATTTRNVVASPLKPVAPGTPAEIQQVAVVNTPKEPSSTPVATARTASASGPSASVSLSDIPAFLPDMALVPTLITKV